MTDTVTMAIATAVAGKTAESITGQAREGLAVLVRRIREKFRDRPAAWAALAAAQADPGAGAAGLARALDDASAEDPEFRRQIRALWSQVRTGHDGVVNAFHGRADKVVQLRDVHGDLHIELSRHGTHTGSVVLGAAARHRDIGQVGALRRSPARGTDAQRRHVREPALYRLSAGPDRHR
jgi:hypothetical protein